MRLLPLVAALAAVPLCAAAQTDPQTESPYKQLTIQELLDTDVSLASRRPDPIRTTAAPVQVLTRDDLRRAGVRVLAEAFRLADAMYVGRFDGRTWIVNARGLSINGANKMQVMIDGRTIYSPLYSGIFWDAQDVLVEDIDRIEIIRGPGASLWGANALHGIINVITRRAADTAGLHVLAGTGNEERAMGEVRYGGRLDEDAAYRVYAKYGYTDEGSLGDGRGAEDPMRRGQVGGRYDRALSPSTELQVQGDAYVGRLGLLASPDTDISGGNLLTRLSHHGGSRTTQVSAFYDYVARSVPNSFGERRHTFDIDAQQVVPAGARHTVVWGGGYRASADDTDVTPLVFFDPRKRTTHLFNLFVQDEIALGPPGVFATGGTKLEHNTYSGWELQPTGRLRWTRGQQTLWGAVSRAVRMPTRFDTDIRVTAGFPFVVVSGNPEIRPEALLAYETGFRSQPATRVTYELALFHNRYDDLRSQELVPGGPLLLGNTLNGQLTGVELAATWEPTTLVRLHGSYAWLHRHIDADPGSLDITGGEGNDPSHLANLQLFTDLRPGLRLNLMGRYVSELPRPRVPAYAEADASLQWEVRRSVEVGLYGKNLLHDQHPEFSSGQPFREEYDRSVFVTLTLRR